MGKLGTVAFHADVVLDAGLPPSLVERKIAKTAGRNPQLRGGEKRGAINSREPTTINHPY